MQSLLIVDFLEENLTLAENMLKAQFNVFLADSCERAVEVQKEHNPDIALINCIIPGSSGVKVLSALTKSEKDFVAIMMTNLKDIEMISDAILHGFDGFIKIPVELDIFVNQLEKAKKIHLLRCNANNFLKAKATKAMSVTFAHYTRNLLTPLIGYLSTLKEALPERVYTSYSKNLYKINKLTHKIEDMLENGDLQEFAYTDKTEFYNIDLDSDT
ncbi:response regulator [Thermodesulfobacteriota bacterium]